MPTFASALALRAPQIPEVAHVGPWAGLTSDQTSDRTFDRSLCDWFTSMLSVLMAETKGGEPDERKPEHDCRHYWRSPRGLIPASDLGRWNRKLAVLAPVLASRACPRCVDLLRDYQSAPAALTLANAPGDEPGAFLVRSVFDADQHASIRRQVMPRLPQARASRQSAA